MYCTLNIAAVNTYKIYATGYGVRDVQQCTTGEILKVVEKDCILLTKVFFFVWRLDKKVTRKLVLVQKCAKAAICRA